MIEYFPFYVLVTLLENCSNQSYLPEHTFVITSDTFLLFKIELRRIFKHVSASKGVHNKRSKSFTLICILLFTNNVSKDYVGVYCSQY
jgi:hypothetical protein